MRATIAQRNRSKKRKDQRKPVSLREFIVFLASVMIIGFLLSLLFTVVVKITKSGSDTEAQGVKQYYSRSI